MLVMYCQAKWHINVRSVVWAMSTAGNGMFSLFLKDRTAARKVFGTGLRLVFNQVVSDRSQKSKLKNVDKNKYIDSI